MKSKKVEQKLNRTWKEFLKANTQHDDHHAAALFRELIALEIKQKHDRQH